jgi:imidazolonepropionase-like amidohydrolase
MKFTAPLAAFLGLVGLASVSWAQPATPPPDRYLVVRCGTLMDVPGKPPKKNATLIVKNGVVDRVVEGPAPDLANETKAGATVTTLDLSNQFVLPGLIDCHVHITNQWDASVRTRMVTDDAADTAVRGVAYARTTLAAGFTTVRDVGAMGTTAFAVRDAIERGEIPGPRVIAAGEAISVTGGHGDPTNNFRADLSGLQSAGVADGVDGCRHAVREQIKRGADVIKLTSTGGVLSASSAGLALHFFEDELKAIVETAHKMGRKVAAHAHGTDGINAALRAGVDSIEHGTYLDDESVTLFKKGGAYLVPTLLAGATVAANADVPGYYLPMVARKAKEVGPKMMDMFRKAHSAGVKIAFGTDSGVSNHGENAKEFALMVEGGMTPTEAIVAATVSAADLIGISSQVGTLEPGKAADIISVSADPTKDVTELSRVRMVIKGGRVFLENGQDVWGRK